MFKIRKHALHGKPIPNDHVLRREQEYWTSSNGLRNVICNLDKNYLQNIINKIERGEFDSEKSKMLSILKNELIYRINEDKK